jgi:hypothetical protein
VLGFTPHLAKLGFFNEKCPTLDVGAPLEWLKLIELSLTMIMGNIMHERCFSNKKSKLRNRFTTHLDLGF